MKKDAVSVSVATDEAMIALAVAHGFEAIGADEGDSMECYKCSEAQLLSLLAALRP